MRPRKYHVTLTQEEYNELLHLVKKGTTQAHKITHAQVLLKLDESFNEKPWNVIIRLPGISRPRLLRLPARMPPGAGPLDPAAHCRPSGGTGGCRFLIRHRGRHYIKKTNLSPGFMKNGASQNPERNS